MNTKKQGDNDKPLGDVQPVKQAQQELVKRNIVNTQGASLKPLQDDQRAKPTTKGYDTEPIKQSVISELEKPKLISKNTNEPNFVNINKNEDVRFSLKKAFHEEYEHKEFRHANRLL